MKNRSSFQLVCSVLICALFTFAGLTPSGYGAANDKKKAMNKSAQEGTHKTHPQSTDLPDLVVGDIGLNSTCRIEVTLRNVGDKELSQKDCKNARLIIQSQQGKEELQLASFSGYEGLRRPGGGVRIKTDMVITEDQTIRVIIDSSRLIMEKNEGNNERTERLTPTCNDHKPATVPDEALGGRSMSKGKKQLKDFGRLDIGAAVGDASAGKQEIVSRTDAEIADIFLHKNQIVVGLQRSGKEQIELATAARLRLMLTAGTHRQSWSLMQMDPGLRQLNREGKTSFETGIELEQPAKVKAQLVGGRPQPLFETALVPEFDRSKSVTSKKGGGRQESQTSPVAKGPASEQVSKMKILSPGTGDRFMAGREVEVEYLIGGRPGDVAVTVNLFKGNRPVTHFVHKTAIGTNERQAVSFPIPENVFPGEDYKIILRVDSAGRETTGQMFTISAPIGEGGGFAPSGLTVGSPLNGDHFDGTSSVPVKWSYHGDDLSTMPDQWLIEFYRDGELVVRERTDCGEAIDHDGVDRYRECFRDVYGIFPEGEYTMRVSGGALSADNQGTFHIGISEDFPLIGVATPEGGRAYARGTQMAIRWHLYGSATPINPRIVVRQEGTVVHDVSPGNQEDGAYSLDITDSWPVGSHYQVTVYNANNPDNFGKSEEFSIIGAPVDFVIKRIGSEDGQNLYADVWNRHTSATPASVFSGDVTFAVYGPERVWEVTRSITLTGRNDWIRVDLGPILKPSDLSSYSCGLEHTVMIDSSDEYVEPNTANNSVTGTIPFSDEGGRVSATIFGMQPGFYCRRGVISEIVLHFTNCGVSAARGSIEIRHVGIFPDNFGDLASDQNDLVHEESVNIRNGVTRNVTIRFAKCWEGTSLEVYGHGDLERWGTNPLLRIPVHER